MSQIQIQVNGEVAVASRFLFPWKGVWLADFEIALEPDALAAYTLSGSATITLGGNSYQGTIDPRNSGSFADRVFVRVVGGGSGWDMVIPGREFPDASGGLTSTIVYTSTAALVGETVSDPSPVTFGIDYVRTMGPASKVFGDRDWYVDPTTGITNVSSWPQATPDASTTISAFDPLKQILHVACDVLLLPGTVFNDPRFNGASPIARTVEQTFDSHGSHAVVFCSSNAVERLGEAFTIACRQAVDSAHLKVYQYRFVLTPSGTDLALQAVTPGAPDINPLHQWQSLAGSFNKYAPSTIVLVGFTADTPPLPYLVTASPLNNPPVETDVDGLTVNIGASAAGVNLAGGASALVPAPWADALKIALTALADALTTGTLASMAAGGSALTAALGLLPPDATIITKAT